VRGDADAQAPEGRSAGERGPGRGAALGIEDLTIPRHELASRELPPAVAYQIVHDDLMLDGNARLNLATFVTTWMEPQADCLMAECFDRNMIDKDEWLQAETGIDVPVRDATQRTCMAALPPSHTT
jgi:hypothetical protein